MYLQEMVTRDDIRDLPPTPCIAVIGKVFKKLSRKFGGVW